MDLRRRGWHLRDRIPIRHHAVSFLSFTGCQNSSLIYARSERGQKLAHRTRQLKVFCGTSVSNRWSNARKGTLAREKSGSRLSSDRVNRLRIFCRISSRMYWASFRGQNRCAGVLKRIAGCVRSRTFCVCSTVWRSKVFHSTEFWPETIPTVIVSCRPHQQR